MQSYDFLQVIFMCLYKEDLDRFLKFKVAFQDTTGKFIDMLMAHWLSSDRGLNLFNIFLFYLEAMFLFLLSSKINSSY